MSKNETRKKTQTFSGMGTEESPYQCVQLYSEAIADIAETPEVIDRLRNGDLVYIKHNSLVMKVSLERTIKEEFGKRVLKDQIVNIDFKYPREEMDPESFRFSEIEYIYRFSSLTKRYFGDALNNLGEPVSWDEFS